MVKEIEAKIKLADRDVLLARIEQAGGTFQNQLLEINTFFDTDRGELKSSDQGLRVRIERFDDGQERVVLTHKGPRSHGKLKSRTETQVIVDSGQSMAEMLESLGYHPVLTFEKRRTRYRVDDCLVELDTMPLLGEYVEIEGPSEQAIEQVRQKLELHHEPTIPTSYIALLRSVMRQHKMSDRYVPMTAQIPQSVVNN